MVVAGCSTEKAWVPVSYVIEPDRGLPPGMNAVAVVDSKVNTATDQKWSELAANMVQDLIQDANHQFGADLKVADRKHLGDTLEEQDLAAAGITSGSEPGQGGKVMEVQGIIQSEINVKVEKHTGYQTTLSGLGLFGGGGSGYYWRDRYRHGYGGVDVDTREVETVARNITVQTAFKLVDTVNNQNWVTYTSPASSRADRTTASPIFGSAKTEAELTARDVVIGGAVSKGVREFVSEFLPVEMEYAIPIESSYNEDCKMGVRMLRADDYEAARRYFRSAITASPQDHRAIFGAGVASEAMGNFEEALQYYKQAYGMEPLRRYGDAKRRLSDHLKRIRKPAQAGGRT
jgi:hypothetical protein